MRQVQVFKFRSFATSIVVGFGIFSAAALLAQGPPATPVRYTEVILHKVRQTVALTGSVESRRESVVASEVEGLVQELMAREGDRVDKGQPLVRLRRKNTELRLAAVQGQLREAKAREQLALTSLERSEGLFEELIISQQQLDDASSEYEAWQGRVAQLQAENSRLEDDLSRTTVRAPYAGVVVQERVAEGEWIGAGGAVAEMIDFADLEVTIDAPGSSYSGIETGTKARVVIGSAGDLEVEGTVRAIVPRADSRARTFPVKISISNPGGKVAVGMLAQVYLPVGQSGDSLIIPKDAVVEQGNQKFVFKIKEDNTVERVAVSSGVPVGAWVTVGSVLSAGDRVITRGNERVFPGQAVEPERLEYELP